ncbi:MAG: hypothetical protein NC923_07685, partial [Candidatus Omnitrophica bacterium]|nr:hypothetical protein [Candidatus Omnitrophota bacterium]
KPFTIDEFSIVGYIDLSVNNEGGIYVVDMHYKDKLAKGFFAELRAGGMWAGVGGENNFLELPDFEGNICQVPYANSIGDSLLYAGIRFGWQDKKKNTEIAVFIMPQERRRFGEANFYPYTGIEAKQRIGFLSGRIAQTSIGARLQDAWRQDTFRAEGFFQVALPRQTKIEIAGGYDTRDRISIASISLTAPLPFIKDTKFRVAYNPQWSSLSRKDNWEIVFGPLLRWGKEIVADMRGLAEAKPDFAQKIEDGLPKPISGPRKVIGVPYEITITYDMDSRQQQIVAGPAAIELDYRYFYNTNAVLENGAPCFGIAYPLNVSDMPFGLSEETFNQVRTMKYLKARLTEKQINELHLVGPNNEALSDETLVLVYQFENTPAAAVVKLNARGLAKADQRNRGAGFLVGTIGSKDGTICDISLGELQHAITNRYLFSRVSDDETNSVATADIPDYVFRLIGMVGTNNVNADFIPGEAGKQFLRQLGQNHVIAARAATNIVEGKVTNAWRRIMYLTEKETTEAYKAGTIKLVRVAHPTVPNHHRYMFAVEATSDEKGTVRGQEVVGEGVSQEVKHYLPIRLSDEIVRRYLALLEGRVWLVNNTSLIIVESGNKAPAGAKKVLGLIYKPDFDKGFIHTYITADNLPYFLEHLRSRQSRVNPYWWYLDSNLNGRYDAEEKKELRAYSSQERDNPQVKEALLLGWKPLWKQGIVDGEGNFSPFVLSIEGAILGENYYANKIQASFTSEEAARRVYNILARPFSEANANYNLSCAIPVASILTNSQLRAELGKLVYNGQAALQLGINRTNPPTYVYLSPILEDCVVVSGQNDSNNPGLPVYPLTSWLGATNRSELKPKYYSQMLLDQSDKPVIRSFKQDSNSTNEVKFWVSRDVNQDGQVLKRNFTDAFGRVIGEFFGPSLKRKIGQSDVELWRIALDLGEIMDILNQTQTNLPCKRLYYMDNNANLRADLGIQGYAVDMGERVLELEGKRIPFNLIVELDKNKSPVRVFGTVGNRDFSLTHNQRFAILPKEIMQELGQDEQSAGFRVGEKNNVFTATHRWAKSEEEPSLPGIWQTNLTKAINFMQTNFTRAPVLSTNATWVKNIVLGYTNTDAALSYSYELFENSNIPEVKIDPQNNTISAVYRDEKREVIAGAQFVVDGQGQLHLMSVSFDLGRTNGLRQTLVWEVSKVGVYYLEVKDKDGVLVEKKEVEYT